MKGEMVRGTKENGKKKDGRCMRTWTSVTDMFGAIAQRGGLV